MALEVIEEALVAVVALVAASVAIEVAVEEVALTVAVEEEEEEAEVAVVAIVLTQELDLLIKEILWLFRERNNPYEVKRLINE